MMNPLQLPMSMSGIDQVHFSGGRPAKPTSLMLIGGELLPSESGRTFKALNPLNQKVLGRAPEASAKDVDTAVTVAKTASATWGQTSASERATVLRAIGQVIAENTETLAQLETANNGKTLEEARADIGDSVRHFNFYADEIEKQKPASFDTSSVLPGTSVQHVRRPYGVAGQIIPWNYPIMMAAWKIAPALAAGNTVVIKSAEQTPLSLLKLGELLQAKGVVPKGVLNILTGGAEAGKALVAHKDVDIVSFTGSTEVGDIISKQLGNKPFIAELGGKSPTIVFPDADLEDAIEGTLFGTMVNQGQVCSSNNRVLVHESIYDQFVAELAKRASQIKLGDGTQPGVKMGPLVSKEQQQRVLGFIQKGIYEGATLVTGSAKAPKGPLAKGNFVLPAVFAERNPNSTIAQEEIFGPVAVVIPFKDEAEAIRLANDTKYGLAASIWTKDPATMARVTPQLKVGIVWENSSQPAMAEIKWGGPKASGNGRHDDLEGYSFLQNVLTAKENFFARGWFAPPTPSA